MQKKQSNDRMRNNGKQKDDRETNVSGNRRSKCTSRNTRNTPHRIEKRQDEKRKQEAELYL